MTDAREEEGQQPPASSAIDFFGSTSTSAEDDVFAQLLSADDQHEQDIEKQSAQQSQAESVDHSPRLDASSPAPEEPSTAIESQVEGQEQVNPLDNDEQAQGAEVEPAPEPAALNDTDKDFSDLLAEFEAEHGDGETIAQSEQVEPVEQTEVGVATNSAVYESEPHPGPAPAHQVPAPAAVASLFADDSDAFDDLLGQSQPETDTDVALPIPASATASPSPVPSLSIEHSRIEDSSAARGDGGAAGDVSLQSMFSNASDWLGDTTVDDSFAVGDGEALQKVEEEDGGAPVPFEIPQGWYDDHGEWHWYTDEEKEQVRLTMLGSGGWDSTATEEVSADPSESAPIADAPYSPALQAPGSMSENAARRTPVPEAAPTLTSNSYDVYTPPSTQQSSYGGLSSSAHSSQPSPYAPSSSSSPYAPQPASTTTTTSYDPYAPTAFASAPSPYAPASQVSGYLPQAGPSTASAPQAPPKPAPPKIQRMASNAYDPPFLRPQKSFIRPPAAVPAASPAYGVPPTLAMSPPLPSTATPPPPPSGPPRRKQTDDRPASRGPTFAPPPPRGPSRTPSVASQSYGQEQAYGAPPMLPSVAAQQLYGSDQHSQPPRPPTSNSQQYNATHDAFDPPLPSVPSQQTHYTHQHHPQQAYGAPPRPPSALSRPSFASLPPRVASPSLAPPPAAQSPNGPPRPLSRGLPKRQHSLFFEPPPPRPEISQRMRSPPQAHRPSFEQVLSPPKTSEPLYSERRTSTDSQHRIGYDSYQGSSDAYSPNVNGFSANAHAKPPPIPSPRREEFPALSRRYDEEGEDMEDPYVSQPRDDSYGQGPEDQYDQYAYESQENQQPPPRSIASPPISWQPQQPSSDPYAPSSLGLVSLDSPQYGEPSGHQSHTPYAPVPTTNSDLGDDPYAPRSAQPSDHYGPTTSPQKAQQISHTPRAPSSYEPSPYSPPISKSVNALPPTDPYARVASPAYSAGYGISPPKNNYFQSMHQGPSDDTYVPQQVLEQKPVSEDPLGRCTLAARNAPLAVFGFGGVLITAFPGIAESDDFHKGHSRGPSYGYASGRGQLWIRSVSEVAVPTALKGDQTAFPGPLVFDSSTPKGAAGDKKKRESVLAYLESEADEIEKGLPYLKSSASRARRDEEGRLVLVRLLRALIIGEGKLAGSPQVEEAVQSALASPTSPNITTAPVGSAAPIADTNGFPSSLYPSTSSTSKGTPVKATPAQLNHLSWLLVHGNKRDAASYAADQGLWSHALVISSCVDPDLWKEIVGRFARAELRETEGAGAIKASYALFSGATTSNVDDLIAASSITDDPAKDQWREVVSAVLHNGKPADLACLDELGSRFLSMNLTTAAQVCFLLSPSSPFLDSTPGAYERPLALLHDPRDEEAVIYAEIAEYARSLVPTPKGQEAAFAALPQLLPHKLSRAWRLAELGEVEQAQRYCSAIEASSKIVKNGPSVLAGAFAASLEDLLERLTGTPSIDPPNAFGSGRKAAKPGLDKLGSWIEGRLTKFIAGEEGAPPPTTKASSEKGKQQGPFAQFSTISPNASGALTRNPSTADFGANLAAAPNGYLGVQSVSRSTSPAAPFTSPYGNASTSTQSSYGEQYGSHFAGGNNAWAGPGQNEQSQEENNGYQPYIPADDAAEDQGEFINPMAQMSLNDEPTHEYKPRQPNQHRVEEDEDEDDLGFGNAALSRNRTPKPSGGGEEVKDKDEKKDEKKDVKKETQPSKPEHKSSWLGKWWGKKEGDAPGPVKANLGEESSMVFDPELKKWVVKGAKPDTTPTFTPAPPPRAQTVSPSRTARPDATSQRAMSATPPPSRPTPSGLSMSSAPPPSGTSGPPPPGRDGPGIRRMKSFLAESVTASEIDTPPPLPPISAGGGGGPPRPPSGARPTPPSIDDLLSRPPSKRPASAAARKGRQRYVDVFQPGAEGQ